MSDTHRTIQYITGNDMKEKATTLFGKLSYGLKYTLTIAIAILATCALCFIFINITTYFAPPLQPMFDQERLGQLGDFLGGTLNPIFGFLTLCILLLSLKAQKNELIITQNEAKLTTLAFETQNELMRLENIRTELIQALKTYIEEYDSTFESDFFIGDDIPISGQTNLGLHLNKNEKYSLNKIVDMNNGLIGGAFNHLLNLRLTSGSDFFSPIYDKLNKIRSITYDIHALCISLIKHSNTEVTGKIWYKKHTNYINKSCSIGAIDYKKQEHLLEVAVEALEEKWNTKYNILIEDLL